MRSLVIDDEFVALTKMASLLASLGECDAATNGQQALELFLKAFKDRRPYDLIAIDINLPNINGICLLNRFQAEERMRNGLRSRKLIVSADSSVSNVRAALASHCDAFLVKPVKRATLIEKLVSFRLLPQKQATCVQAEATQSCPPDSPVPE